MRQEGVRPTKLLFYRYFAVINSSSMRTITDKCSTTSTADELSGSTNVNNFERPWTPKIRIWKIFARFRVVTRPVQEWIWPKSLDNGDRPRQPAYDCVYYVQKAQYAQTHAKKPSTCYNLFMKEYMKDKAHDIASARQACADGTPICQRLRGDSVLCRFLASRYCYRAAVLISSVTNHATVCPFPCGLFTRKRKSGQKPKFGWRLNS